MLSSLAVPALQRDMTSYSMEAAPPPKVVFSRFKEGIPKSLCVMQALEKKTLTNVGAMQIQRMQCHRQSSWRLAFRNSQHQFDKNKHYFEEALEGNTTLIEVPDEKKAEVSSSSEGTQRA